MRSNNGRFAPWIVLASLGLICVAIADGQEGSIQEGDAKVSGFQAFSITKGPNGVGSHFVFVHAPGIRLKLHSDKKSLDATSDRAEGDVSGQNLLIEMTLSGGVHMKMVRPSSEKSSTETQTVTVDGSSAHYTAASNKIHVEGSVTIHDDDPGANRTLVTKGSSADLVMSPQGTKSEALRTGELYGPVTSDITGLRTVAGEGGGQVKKAPFHIHSTSAHALFNYVERTITLLGHVNVTSDDPTLPSESNISKETIYLNPDGSIDRVEGGGEPGITTISVESGGNP